jgi:hypothetical protein
MEKVGGTIRQGARPFSWTSVLQHRRKQAELASELALGPESTESNKSPLTDRRNRTLKNQWLGIVSNQPGGR